VAISPSEEEGVAADKFVRFQLEAALLVVPTRCITATHDIGFAVADGAGTSAAQFLERQELLNPITPGESQFVAERSHCNEGERIFPQRRRGAGGGGITHLFISFLRGLHLTV
jgi:hypothetical protein